MKGAVALAALGHLLLPGCGGRTSGASSRPEAPSDAATVSLGEAGGAPTSDSGALDASVSGDQVGPPVDLTHGPSVWIGQVDMTVTYPAGYDGGDVVPDDTTLLTAPEKVVLILSATTGPVSGTITFGDDSPPPRATDPKMSYPLEPTMLRDPSGQTFPLLPTNWMNSPFPGFSYSLVSSTLSGNLLELAFVPTDLWSGWCALQDPTTLGSPALSDNTDPCACDGGTCTALSTPIRRVDLTVGGDTMQGQLSLPAGPDLIASPTIRLQRVQ